MQLQIQRLRPYATIPTQATAGSAGYDLYAALEAPVSIPVGEIVRIPTGIAAAPDRKDVALFIMARSGLASKHGINLANGVGLVDSDYRGELLVPLMNLGKEPLLRRTRHANCTVGGITCALPDLHRCGTASRNGTRFKRIRFYWSFLMHGSACSGAAPFSAAVPTV